jgi:CRP/FNR family transcriptional regulator
VARQAQLELPDETSRRVDKPSIRTFPFDSTDLLGTKRLTTRDRTHLATISTRMRVRAGTTVYNRGEAATAVYTIAEGAAVSFRPLDDGTRRVMAFLFTEDLFGLSRAGVYVNSVFALTPLTIFRIQLDALKTMLLRNPELQLHFLCKVTHALRESQRHAILVGCRDPVARVGRFLTMMEDAQPSQEPGVINLPMSRRDIGDYLNLTVERVTNALRELENRHLVTATGTREVRITDRRGMQALTGND